MATNNLKAHETEIANAIRTKKGTTAKINPQDFAKEILSITTGGKTVTEYFNESVELWTDDAHTFFDGNDGTIMIDSIESIEPSGVLRVEFQSASGSTLAGKSFTLYADSEFAPSSAKVRGDRYSLQISKYGSYGMAIFYAYEYVYGQGYRKTGEIITSSGSTIASVVIGWQGESSNYAQIKYNLIAIR